MTLHLIEKTDQAAPHWQMIAWAIANAQPGGDFAIALQCLYNELSPADQARCRAEVDQCNKAKRGEFYAEVSRWNRKLTAEEERTHHLA